MSPDFATEFMAAADGAQRQADILALPRALYRDGVINICQKKTQARVELPVDMAQELTARLADELARAAQRKVTQAKPTLLVCETTDAPWKADYFRHVFAALRERAIAAATATGNTALAAELPDLQFMHLRHTAITRLLEAGCTAELASTISGHTLAHCTAIIDRYRIRTADMARTAFGMRISHEGKGGKTTGSDQ